MKVEFPVQMQYVAGTQAYKGEQVYTRADALEYFRKVASASKLPFVYLSAGVTNAAFVETLELAVESGGHFHGVLCGRATWQDAVPVFVKQGARKCEEWLATTGAENILRVNRALEGASPWYEKFSA